MNKTCTPLLPLMQNDAYCFNKHHGNQSESSNSQSGNHHGQTQRPTPSHVGARSTFASSSRRSRTPRAGQGARRPGQDRQRQRTTGRNAARGGTSLGHTTGCWKQVAEHLCALLHGIALSRNSRVSQHAPVHAWAELLAWNTCKRLDIRRMFRRDAASTPLRNYVVAGKTKCGSHLRYAARLINRGF